MDVSGLEQELSIETEDVRQLLLQIRRETAAEVQAAKKTFGRLAQEWHTRISSRLVCPANEERHIGHLAALAEMREGELTKGAIETVFATLLKPAGPLGATTINKVRGTGRLIVRDAQANGDWMGLNPFEHVRRLPQAKPVYARLTIVEAQRLVWGLRRLPVMQRLLKAMLFLGTRPGELFALRKSDVDLSRRTVIIRRSHGRNRTKTGREREFPIPSGILRDIRRAIEESSSELVFPGRNGKRRGRNGRMAERLRVALGRAGVVVGYEYRCRQTGCGYSDTRPNRLPARCPRCEARLYRTPIGKPLRFYDLRHAAATLHRQAGCDPLVVQLVLGHSATNTTDAVYTHLDEDYVRRELSKLRLGGEP